jgi:hypothetical protein
MPPDPANLRFFVDESILGVGKALAIARTDVIHTGHPLIPEVPLGAGYGKRARRERWHTPAAPVNTGGLGLLIRRFGVRVPGGPQDSGRSLSGSR